VTDLTLEAAEREAVLRALRLTGWNKQAAAQVLGVAKSTLYRKIRRHQLEEPEPTQRLLSARIPSVVTRAAEPDLPTSCVDRPIGGMVST